MSAPTFQYAEKQDWACDSALPVMWSAAQRAVWKFSQQSPERKQDIINSVGVALDAKALAFVNAARWIVACPFDGCSSAQDASFLDQRYWCIDCANRAVGGQWITVVWPDNIAEIESTLELRPTGARHWLPGETMQDLIDQNAQHTGEE
jgi:hypothetical protein